MDFTFADKKLQRPYVERRFNAKMAVGVVSAFRDAMDTIRDAPDERVFYALKSLRFERLSGARKHQHSMRLNDQYRLILELIERPAQTKEVLVVEIEDYR